jgi:hypothetical protein
MMSINNKLILEPYTGTGELKANTSGGFTTITQRTNLIGLKVLSGTKILFGGEYFPLNEGSIVYFKEEILCTHPWSKEVYECDAIGKPFIVADALFAIGFEAYRDEA